MSSKDEELVNKIGGIAILVLGIGYGISSIGDIPSTPGEHHLEAFCDIIESSADHYDEVRFGPSYIDQDQDIVKAVAARRNALAEYMPDGRFEAWPGEIKKLFAYDDGPQTYISIDVEFHCDTEIESRSIAQGTELFEQFRQFKEGDEVVISGQFAIAGPHYFSETSVFESGAMEAPEFEGSITQVSAR